MTTTRRLTGTLKRRRHLHHERRCLLLEVIVQYGGKCECCGETEPMFLTIDHVGRKPKGEPGGHHLYRWLRQQGFPRADYRLLCFNCNSGRARAGGVCPHKQKRSTLGARRA